MTNRNRILTHYRILILQIRALTNGDEFRSDNNTGYLLMGRREKQIIDVFNVCNTYGLSPPMYDSYYFCGIPIQFTDRDTQLDYVKLVAP